MSSEEQTPPMDEPTGFPGDKLTAAREAKGLSVAQVATRMNLSPHYIEAIESGDFEVLPSLVFARGYVRNYARLLGLDEAMLVQHVGGSTAPTAPRPVTSVPQDVKLSDPRVRFSGFIFLAGIIGITLWWWQTQYGSAEQPEQSVVVEQSAVAEDGTLRLPQLSDSGSGNDSAEEIKIDEPDLPLESVADADAEEVEPQGLSQEQVDALAAEMKQQSAAEINAPEAGNQVAAVVASTPVVTAEPPLAAGDARLKVSFSDECWVEVRDANGKLLISGIRNPSKGIDLTAAAPLKVLFGAVSAVERVEINGKVLEQIGSGSKNVARLTLP